MEIGGIGSSICQSRKRLPCSRPHSDSAELDSLLLTLAKLDDRASTFFPALEFFIVKIPENVPLEPRTAIHNKMPKMAALHKLYVQEEWTFKDDIMQLSRLDGKRPEQQEAKRAHRARESEENML